MLVSVRIDLDRIGVVNSKKLFVLKIQQHRNFEFLEKPLELLRLPHMTSIVLKIDVNVTPVSTGCPFV